MAAPARRLLHVFSTFAIGGPQRRFAQLANALGERYRHRLIALDGRCDARPLVEAPLEIRALAVDKGRPLGNLLRFHAVLREERPDLLVTYNWGAVEWAFVNRLRHVAPHLHVEDGFGPEEVQGQLPRRVRFRRLALARSRVVLPSTVLQRIALEVWRLDPARVQLIPNGIDCARYARPRLPHDGPPVIGTVATLRHEKNLGRLLEAFRGLGGRARLVIAGDGPERPALEARARALGVAAEFTGYVERPEEILAGFDLFALSSDTEQMPLSVVEAMAAGLPVASVEVGDVAQMVAPENRPFLAPAGDGPGLARAMAALLDDPAARARVGAANAMRARTLYDEATMVAAYDRLWAG